MKLWCQSERTTDIPQTHLHSGPHLFRLGKHWTAPSLNSTHRHTDDVFIQLHICLMVWRIVHTLTQTHRLKGSASWLVFCHCWLDFYANNTNEGLSIGIIKHNAFIVFIFSSFFCCCQCHFHRSTFFFWANFKGILIGI